MRPFLNGEFNGRDLEDRFIPASAAEPEIELDAVLDHIRTGAPLDPEVARRVRERADRIRQEVLEKHGVLNVAVDLRREGRDVTEGSAIRMVGSAALTEQVAASVVFYRKVTQAS